MLSLASVASSFVLYFLVPDLLAQSGHLVDLLQYCQKTLARSTRGRTVRRIIKRKGCRKATSARNSGIPERRVSPRCHGDQRPRSKKEVFQPHLPVRLPCYDLAPVTTFALGRSSRSRPSGARGSHGLTGGVYKARERIHRAMADARFLANPASRSRVADYDPNWDGFSRSASRRRVASLCSRHCNPCVAPDVRAVLI